jgi:hypothetical protein
MSGADRSRVPANKPTRFQWVRPNEEGFESLRRLARSVDVILDPPRKRLNLYHVADA